ncbi:MAG TPA: DUF916 domain-containing protein [Nitrolancea sp.]|jgi:hypothetical protein|nr:DUF916 domain-containing protein [Nitrolancea sp.]
MRSLKVVARFLSAVMAITLFAALASGVAADAPINLGIKPVGATGSYFTLTLSPGETRQLTVSLGNYGSQSVAAKTYAADAYTIVNGGFGVRLDGQPTSGTTHWLSYSSQTMQIDAGKSETRTFNVSVPSDAKPGEYLTALVIQNAIPTSASDSGSVAINQVNRQAIAVSITVPGPMVPGLAINQISYKPVGDRSVLDFDVANTGNMNLKPTGEFTLTSKADQEISHGPIQMGSFYAGNTTTVEGLLAQQLNPGDYVASLSLTDAKSGVKAEKTLALNIPVPAQPVANSSGAASTGAAVNQSPVAQPATAKSTSAARLVLLGLAVLLLIGLLTFLVYLLRRQRALRAVPQSTAPARESILAQATTPLPSVPSPLLPDRTRPEPVPIRQLRPRDIDDSRDTRKRGA